MLRACFYWRGGTLTCIIIDSRRQYSADLPQGGLQISCKLEFKCDNADLLSNIKKLKIILAKFIFGGSVVIHQFAKFSFPPKFVVIRYLVQAQSVILCVGGQSGWWVNN